jgi:hypothetical protein
MTLEQKIDQILANNGLMFSEKEDIFKAMGEILEATACAMQNDEPYATESIDRMLNMGREIMDYEHFIVMNPYTVND